MAKTRSTVMIENSIRTKQYIANLLEENKASVPLDLWFDIGIMLDKYTPAWLVPDSKDKHAIRMWNLLTRDNKERTFVGTVPDDGP